MDLQTGKITYGKLQINEKDQYYYVPVLFTDGKEVYGMYTPKKLDFTSEGAMVCLVTDTMDDMGTAIVEIEHLTE